LSIPGKGRARAGKIPVALLRIANFADGFMLGDPATGPPATPGTPLFPPQDTRGLNVKRRIERHTLAILAAISWLEAPRPRPNPSR